MSQPANSAPNRTRLGLILRLGTKSAPPSQTATITATSDHFGESFAWDNPNPFIVPDDPAQAHLRNLAEIARERRYESFGPLQPIPENKFYVDDMFEDSDEDLDEDSDDEDSDEDYEDYTLKPIVLPRLLHTVPLCDIPSRLTLPTPPPSPPPPPPPTRRPSFDEDPPATWADLAQVYNDIAEAEERVIRKAKRNALRSRLKVLAVLGPEASSAV